MIQYLIVGSHFYDCWQFVLKEMKLAQYFRVQFCCFVSVIGVLGYKEDFKALLQNGYTRKYIFGATVCMFTLLAGTMALIDTIIGNSLHSSTVTILPYTVAFMDSEIFYKLVMAYCLIFDVCSLFYLCDLVINRVGKQFLF